MLPCVAAASREDDLKALRARIDTLRTELDGRESDRREARDALRASETAISQATRALAALEAEGRQLRAAVKELEERRGALGRELAAREAALGRLLAARAAGGTPGVFRLLLAGEEPSEIARRLHYLSRLSQAAARVIDMHRAGLAELERLRGESQARARELRDVETRQRADRDRVVAERRERRKVLERIARELRSGKRQMQQMVADERRLARVVQEIGRVLATRPGAGYRPVRPPAAAPLAAPRSFVSLRGSLAWPVHGELSRRAAAQRAGRSGGKGVFIRAPQGEAVRAVAAGMVVFADWMRGFGNLLIVDHGEAYLSVYGHNDSLLKQAGEAVGFGEALATVGASGGREESGVYFEIRHQGEAIDPLPWIGAR